MFGAWSISRAQLLSNFSDLFPLQQIIIMWKVFFSAFLSESWRKLFWECSNFREYSEYPCPGLLSLQSSHLNIPRHLRAPGWGNISHWLELNCSRDFGDGWQAKTGNHYKHRTMLTLTISLLFYQSFISTLKWDNFVLIDRLVGKEVDKNKPKSSEGSGKVMTTITMAGSLSDPEWQIYIASSPCHRLYLLTTKQPK